ncbi:DUF3325 domain-containing protein [Nitrospira sp. Ecomares 2.1]
MDILVFLLSYAGLFTLCLAMPKHFQVMLGKPFLPSSPSMLILKIVGWLILGLSFAMAVDTAGWSFGPVRWVGYLAIGGLTLIFGLPFAPRLVLLLGILTCCGGPLAVLVFLLD